MSTLSSRARAALSALLAVAVFFVAVIGWKGLTLLSLARDADAKALAVAEFYRERIIPRLADLRGATPATEPLIASLLALGAPDSEAVHEVLKTQKHLIAVEAAAPDAPASTALARELGHNGDVQPLLDAYNIRAQAWNNAIDDRLGGFYARLFGLEDRFLLRADGRLETETIIAF